MVREQIKIIKKTTIEKYNKSNLIYDSNHSFYKYHNINKFDNLSFKSKHSLLVNVFNDLDKFSRVKTHKENTKEKKTNVDDTSSELYNELLEISFDQKNDFSDDIRSKMDPKYDATNLTLDPYHHEE